MKHGKKYVDSAKLIDRATQYDVAEALDIAVKTGKASKTGVEVRTTVATADGIAVDRNLHVVLREGLHELEGGEELSVSEVCLPLAVLVEDEAEDDAVLKTGLVKDQRRDRVEAVEPAARLVDRFGNEIRGEGLVEKLLIFKRVMILRERH